MAWGWLTNLIVSAIVGWLLKPDEPDFPEQTDDGTLVNKASSLAQIPVIYGKRKVGGTRVFVETSGTDNEYLYIALVLCEGEVSNIGNVWINDELSTDSKYSGLVTITEHTGADNQAVCSTLYNSGNGAPSWDSDYKLSGIAYLGIRLKWDREVFGSIPNFHAEVEGRICYDPRAAGGNGDYIYTTNPAICLLDYLTNTRYGKGLPTSAFESDVFSGVSGSSSWHDAADLCDDPVTPYTGSGTIAKFSCNAVINTDATLMNNVKVLLSGMRGLMPYTQGEYRIVIEDELDGSAVFNFTEEHIVDGIAITGEKKSDRYNRVITTFTNPDNNWQQDQIEYPEAGSSTYTTYLSDDNNFKLERTVNLKTVTNVYQAYNIARTILRKSRESLRCSFLSTTEALQCAVGDIVTVTHSTPAWTVKPFRIMDMALQSDGTVTLSMVEHQDAVYSWTETSQAPVIADTGLPNPFSVVAPTSLSVASGENYQVTNDDGSTQPRMLISWTDSTDNFVDHYIIQYGTSSTWDGEIKTDGSPIYVAGVTSGSTYNIRVKAVNSMGISSTWLTGTHTIANLVGGGQGGITTFSQGITTDGYPSTDIEAGDLWFDTDNDNKLYRYDGTDPYNNSGWVSAQDGTIPTGTLASLDEVTEGEINLTNDELADISTDLGAITAGSLNINNLFTVSSTGVAVIKSASEDSRVEINGNKILVYDGSDLRVKLGYLGT